MSSCQNSVSLAKLGEDACTGGLGELDPVNACESQKTDTVITNRLGEGIIERKLYFLIFTPSHHSAASAARLALLLGRRFSTCLRYWPV
jgi:hypothetical protein